MFLREAFSDYFEPTNVLYIGRGSHKSRNFMTFMRVNLCPPTRSLSEVCPLITMYQLGSPDTYININIYCYRETQTHISIHIYTHHTYTHTKNIYIYIHQYIRMHTHTKTYKNW